MKKLLTITTALGLALGAWTAVPALAQGQGAPGQQKGKGPFGKQQGPQDGTGKQGKGKGKQGKGKQGKGKQGGPNAPTQTPPTN